MLDFSNALVAFRKLSESLPRGVGVTITANGGPKFIFKPMVLERNAQAHEVVLVRCSDTFGHLVSFCYYSIYMNVKVCVVALLSSQSQISLLHVVKSS